MRIVVKINIERRASQSDVIPSAVEGCAAHTVEYWRKLLEIQSVVVEIRSEAVEIEF